MSEFLDFEGDEVPGVDVSDLRKVWGTCQEVQDSPQTCAVGLEVLKATCSPGCNLQAGWYRAMLVQILCRDDRPLSHFVHGGEVDEAVIQIAATFPMKKTQSGVIYDSFPFDVDAFVAQVEERAKHRHLP